MRKITRLLAAFALAATTLAPAAVDARDRRHDGYYSRHYDGYYDRRRHWRGHDHDDEALAAGVIGLVLGLAIGSAASQPPEPRARCYDNYQRCAPPPGYYDRGYCDSRCDPRYDPRYDYDRRSAYERDYGGPPPGAYYEREPQCMRRERQWDRYANRYVVVDVPC